MSCFANYNIPRDSPVPPRADKTVAKDSLLAEFTPGERDYIVHNLYPTLKLALKHFITEAKHHNQITERAESPEVQECASTCKVDISVVTSSDPKLVE